MNTHKNARLSYVRRVDLVQQGRRPHVNQSQLARDSQVSRRTVRKWLRRYAEANKYTQIISTSRRWPGLRDVPLAMVLTRR